MNMLYKFSHHCGVTPSKPHIPLAFFPMVDEDYIIIQNSDLEGPYEYMEEVIDYMIPLLSNQKIIQIKFSKKDIDIPRTKKYEGLSLPQFNFLIKNSKAVICNSPYTHEIASSLNKPSVLITDEIKLNQCPPSWHKKSKQFSKNCFAERIAKAALDYCEIDNFIESLEPFYCGEAYKTKVLEVVPNFNPLDIGLKNQAINLRIDWTNEEKHIESFILLNHVNVITNKVYKFKESYLEKLKQNIIYINFEVSKETSPEDIEYYKNFTKNLRFFCRDEKAIQSIRLKFIDEQIHLEKTIQKKDLDIDQYICNNTIYKSSKMIISNKKTYTSKASMNDDIQFDPSNYEKIIDRKDFWEDSEHLKLLNIKND